MYLTVMIILIATVVGCRNSGKVNEDVFEENIYVPKYSNGFEISCKRGEKSVLIRSVNPWQGANGESKNLLILRGGEEAPVGFEGVVMKGDAKRVVCMSSGHMSMIELLGKEESIVGGSSLDYVMSPKLQKRRGDMREIGYEGAFDYEALIASSPDLVVLYGVYGVSPIEPKLEELGIPYIYVGDYLEDSPLGKAEWIVVLGECLGERELAEEKFEEICNRYEDVKQKVSKGNRGNKVILNAPYGGSWFMPGRDSYMVKLIEDAGGEYLYGGKGNRSEAVSDEEATLMLAKADVWLNPGREYRTIDDIKSRVKNSVNVKSVKAERIYDNTKRSSSSGGNDFYESGIVNPDLILRDLIKIFYPEKVEEEFYYYKKL